MSDTMQGTRLPDNTRPRKTWPMGAYGRLESEDGIWEWYVKTPNGNGGRLGQHEVIEHEDETITVSPSIQAFAYVHAPEWHGWLERGVWRSV